MDAREKPDLATTSGIPEGGTEITSHPARILLAAGHETSAARLLGPSYSVETFDLGDAALRAVHANPPDLIVLEVVPGPNALQTLRALRAEESTHFIPVILLAAPGNEEVAIEGLKAGATDYLLTPFSASGLLARVHAALGQARLRKEQADRLRDASAELEAFSYSVSHDLRAPLRAIDGFSQALQADYADKLDEDARRYLDRVRAAAQRMAQLIDDLLSLSRISRLEMTRGPLDLTRMARRTLDELARREPERHIETAVAEGLATRGDSRLVQALLESLLGNAWKFTSKTDPARIEVGSERRGGQTVFFVRDNGAGFDMRYAGKLFAPFQRLHSPRDFEGTGIGLAAAQRVVARHGGHIWTQASPGAGATFYFTLAEGA